MAAGSVVVPAAAAAAADFTSHPDILPPPFMGLIASSALKYEHNHCSKEIQDTYESHDAHINVYINI